MSFIKRRKNDHSISYKLLKIFSFVTSSERFINKHTSSLKYFRIILRQTENTVTH